MGGKADEVGRSAVGMARGWGGAPSAEQMRELERFLREGPQCVRWELLQALKQALARTRDGVRVNIERSVWSGFYLVYGRFDPGDVIRRMVTDVMRLIRSCPHAPPVTGGDVLLLQMRVADDKDTVGVDGLLEALEQRVRSDGFERVWPTVEQAVRVVFL
jgi:hypothetical protein